jgi:hypothetical protein
MTEAAAICKLFDDWVDHRSSVIMPAYESVQKKPRDTNPVLWSASGVFPQCYCTRLRHCISLKKQPAQPVAEIWAVGNGPVPHFHRYGTMLSVLLRTLVDGTFDGDLEKAVFDDLTAYNRVEAEVAAAKYLAKLSDSDFVAVTSRSHRELILEFIKYM